MQDDRVERTTCIRQTKRGDGICYCVNQCKKIGIERTQVEDWLAPSQVVTLNYLKGPVVIHEGVSVEMFKKGCSRNFPEVNQTEQECKNRYYQETI